MDKRSVAIAGIASCQCSDMARDLTKLAVTEMDADSKRQMLQDVKNRLQDVANCLEQVEIEDDAR
jgi:hypothetical protein